MAPPPPTPFLLLRAHHAPLTDLCFTPDNAYLYAGDQHGTLSITDLAARRVVSVWHAHDRGVLAVGHWAHGLVSQGRDNKILFYKPLPPPPHTAVGRVLPGVVPTTDPPKVKHEMPSNSLNFCRFSIVALPVAERADASSAAHGLIAVPNLVDSELIDIYHLPSMRRVHSAVNHVPRPNGPETPRSGLVMSLHLGVVVSPGRVALAAGYEDGRVEVWSCPLPKIQPRDAPWWDGKKADTAGDEKLWTRDWQGKAHNEAGAYGNMGVALTPVMAMAVDSAFTRAFTVSADHILCRVDLTAALAGNGDATTLTSYPMKHIGHSALKVSADGRVVAVGGWDGRIRLFSAASFKSLGTLSYHRESVAALAFANPQRAAGLLPAPPAPGDGAEDMSEGESESESESASASASASTSDDSDDEDTSLVPRERWLASGGKDRRIALWGLMDFSGSAAAP